MKTKIPATIILLAPLALLSACQNPTTQWLGTYVGEQKDLAEGDSPEAIALRRVQLVINPDNTFVLTKGGFPLSGTVSASSQKATLNVKKILDQPVEKASPNAVYEPITLSKDKNNNYILTDPADFGRPPIQLKKSNTAD